MKNPLLLFLFVSACWTGLGCVLARRLGRVDPELYDRVGGRPGLPPLVARAAPLHQLSSRAKIRDLIDPDNHAGSDPVAPGHFILASTAKSGLKTTFFGLAGKVSSKRLLR